MGCLLAGSLTAAPQAQKTRSKPAAAKKTPAAQPATPSAAPAAWQTDLMVRHDELVSVNGTGTDTALQSELLEMGAQDQAARGYVHGEPVNKARLTTAANLKDVDAALTAKLKMVIAANGWPTIHMVGYRASNAAMLVLTHSADHAWQRSLLPQLETLADEGKIDGSALALVVDKELVSEGKLQRYGTQFKAMPDGTMAIYAVEDPATLDARRAKVFLPPLAPYEQMMAGMYHMRVSKEIAMAQAPADADLPDAPSTPIPETREEPKAR